MLIALLRRYLRPYRGAVAVVVALVLVQAIGNLYLPNLNADIINNGVAKGDVGYIWSVGGLMLAVTAVLGVVSVVAVYYASRTAMGVGRDLRWDVFDRVQYFAAPEVNRFGTASLVTRNTNDVQQVQLFTQIALTLMVLAPIMSIGGVVMAMRTDLRLSTLLLVIVPVMGVVIGLVMARAVPLFRSMQVKIDTLNRVLREQIGGVRVIRAFVRSDYETRRYAEANADLTRTTLRVNQIFAVAMPSLMLIFNLSSVAVIWFGGRLVAAGSMQIGGLTAFLSYLMQILGSVMMATMMIILVPRAAASAERILAVVDTQPSVRTPEHPVEVTAPVGLVEFRDVTFAYPGAEDAVLHGVSVVLRPGQTTAVVGGTGSGKSTLINLIPRFFDVTRGRLLVDGVDVREQDLDRLWSGLGLVPQRPFLFTGSVADNLRFGAPDATDAELWFALEVAQAADFVAAMPDGLDTAIAQGGVSVSGGQRQRLAIARALVRRPRILLFDDSFSALDAATDARLRTALHREIRDATVVIVAQRVSTILHADQIVVLDEGAVVGVGAHEELMVSCDAYREIVISQLGAQAA